MRFNKFSEFGVRREYSSNWSTLRIFECSWYILRLYSKKSNFHQKHKKVLNLNAQGCNKIKNYQFRYRDKIVYEYE
jgi:hypothetical protein